MRTPLLNARHCEDLTLIAGLYMYAAFTDHRLHTGEGEYVGIYQLAFAICVHSEVVAKW